MFALADVNSFYANCEKLFRPDLRNRAVVVLSNNDGCVIARSSEAKREGVKMGIPWFQLRRQSFSNEIIAFSSNYELYASMSARVMSCLEEISPRVEQYSIDEMFIDVKGIDSCLTYEAFGHKLRDQVKNWTGLTIGVGFGPTKTLAKAAQWASKEWPQFKGVLVLSTNNPERTTKLLSLMPLTEIWGVGGKTANKLNSMGIKTALDLSRANPLLIRKNFSVVLERTVRELTGECCISLEEAPSPKQQIICSRSFGQPINQYDDLRQAICLYAERAAEKLREERQHCRHISVFIKTSPFIQTGKSYSNTAGEKLIIPTMDTREIVAGSVRALERIWRDGFRYVKAGVMLNDFTATGMAQFDMFNAAKTHPNSEPLMCVVDKINRSGRGQIWFAGSGVNAKWNMKRNLLSPAYTTRWHDLPKAKL